MNKVKKNFELLIKIFYGKKKIYVFCNVQNKELKMILNRINTSQSEPKTRNKGILRAAYFSSLVGIPFSMASSKIMKKVPSVTREDSIQIRRGISKALTDTGLRDKGVKAIFVESKDVKTSEKYVSDYLKMAFKETPKKDRKPLRYIMESLKISSSENRFLRKLAMNIDSPNMKTVEMDRMIEKMMATSILSQIKASKSVVFLKNVNAIIVPDKKLVTSAFHELGHALNANTSKIGDLLQRYKKFSSKAAFIISTIALLPKKKANDETPSKGIGKVTHFIKKNAGVLSFVSMLPLVAEEAMASVKGINVAEKVLDNKALLKKVKMINARGILCHVLAAVSTGVVTAVSVKIKDAIQTKHEEKVAKKALSNKK